MKWKNKRGISKSISKSKTRTVLKTLLDYDIQNRNIERRLFRLFVGSKLLDIIKNNNPQNEFDAVLGFYNGLNVKEYPLFLKDSLAGGRGYSSEVSFFLGPYEEDGYKVEKDEVHFWAQETETIIPLKEFENLNIEFAQKALEAATKFNLKDLGHIDQQWIDDIKKLDQNKRVTFLTPVGDRVPVDVLERLEEFLEKVRKNPGDDMTRRLVYQMFDGMDRYKVRAIISAAVAGGLSAVAIDVYSRGKSPIPTGKIATVSLLIITVGLEVLYGK